VGGLTALNGWFPQMPCFNSSLISMSRFSTSVKAPIVPVRSEYRWACSAERFRGDDVLTVLLWFIERRRGRNRVVVFTPKW
jgi:hypothetical protein